MRNIGIFCHYMYPTLFTIGNTMILFIYMNRFHHMHLDFSRPQCYYFLRNPKNISPVR